MLKHLRILVDVISMFIIILSAHFVFGVVVTEEESVDVAINWLYQNSVNREEQPSRTIRNITIETRDDLLVYYILEFYPSGWVIVSGDNSCYPIIGYSYQGTLNSSNRSPAFEEWMRIRADEVHHIIANRLVPTTATRKLWEILTLDPHVYQIRYSLDPTLPETVGPLLATEWDQGQYYNEYCPAASDGPGGHVWAGCVATAMAQVMKYWNYPSTGVGSHGYTENDYGWQYANFGATTYNWTSMPVPKATSSNTSLAVLLYHCGVSLDMDYGVPPDGSGASTANVPTALKTYFRYSRAAVYLSRSAFPDQDSWEAVIRRNIDGGRPIQYRGSGDDGGHSFVLDGYQYTNYFHFNWGWSGTNNGYFYLSNLNPGSYDYTEYQAANFNILPANQMPEPSVHDVSVDSSITLGDYIELYVASDNLGEDSDDGGITISFPDFTGGSDDQYVSLYSASSGMVYSEFATGDQIWRREGYQDNASYLMVEGSHSSWYGGGLKYLIVRVYEVDPKAWTGSRRF